MKKRILVVLMVLLAVLTVPVYAKGNNGFFADDDVKVTEDLDTTCFAAGNNVEVSSKVDGLSFIAGNNVSISSTQDHLFAAGNNVNLEGVTAKDAFVAGNSVTIDNSTIRDLYVAAATIRVDSNISRNAYLGGSKVVINSTIDGDVKIAAEDIRIGKDAVINGTLLYPDTSEISISDTAVVKATKTYEGESDFDYEVSTKAIIVGYIISFLSLLIVAFVLLATHKRFFKEIKESEKSGADSFKQLAIGLIALIVIPIACVFAMITILGLPLALITLVLYVIMIYLSTIPTAYYIGHWVMNGKETNDYLVLGVSLLVLFVLTKLPLIGGVVGAINLFIGLGLFLTTTKQVLTEKKK